jgi:type II secretory pathway pseudopilin PulG
MTLIEVLAALAILVVLSGGVVGFFLGVTDRRDQLARLAAQQRDAAALFDRLEAALMTSLAVAPDGSAGIRGDEKSITVVARSVYPVFEGPSAVADAAVMTLSFDEARAACDCTLAPLAGAGEPLTESILEHVERIRFRYLRARNWSDSFESLSAGGLPAAIEISVWLEPRTGPRSQQAPPAPTPADFATYGGDPESEDLPFGPLDLPPEPEQAPWTPREPDYLRVLVVPEGPPMGWEPTP